MGQVTRFARFRQPKLTYRLGYKEEDELQQVPGDTPEDLAADPTTIIEVARQVDVVSPVSDLALGITPVAFGASPTWTNLANLTDGNDTGTFASGPNYVEPSTVDKGFSIDLGAPAAVSSMQFRFTPYAPDSGYHIESSPDNSTWTDRAYTRTGPVGAVYTYTLTGGPFTFRYWRIRRSYHGYIGPQRVYTWSIAGSTTVSSDKAWYGTELVNDGDDATYEPSDGVDEVLRMLFDIDQRLDRVVLKVGSEFSGSVTYELQHATALDFSDAVTDATVTLTTTGSYTLDTLTFTWDPTAAYSLWQIVSSEDENRRFYTIEAYEASTDLSAYQPIAEKDQPNGYPSLDGSGLVPVDELPNVEDLNTAETDTTLVLAPDGAGGVEFVAVAQPDIDAADVNFDNSGGGTGTNVQDELEEILAQIGFGVSSVGSLSKVAGPQTVVDDATWNEFPGAIRLDANRLLVVFRGNGTNHQTNGQVCGVIGTLSATQDSITAWGTKFTILDDAGDLRVEDGVSIIDGLIVIAYRYFDGSDNHDPSLIICDDAPADFTETSTWGSPIALPDPGGTVQKYTQGHVHKLQNDTYLLGGGFDSGGTHSVGAWTWTGTVDDPSAATFTVIGSGATDWSEVAIEEMADGTLRAHLNRANQTGHYEAHSTNHGSTWSAPASLFTGAGWPTFRILQSGLGLSVYRHSTNGDNEWRQEGDDTDTGWGSATTLDTNGTRGAYCTILQITPNNILVIAGIEYASDGSTGTADLFAYWFHDSSTFASGIPPSDADYLIGTANAGLPDAIVVGTTPGGELGGTWASPTVDATHSGSAHVPLSSATPLVESGAGSAGVGTSSSRDDHVHPAASSSSSDTGGDHLHVIEVFNGDAATTVFTIADEPFDPDAVFAFVGGSWTAVTVSGTDNTTITFAVAPGSGTGNVVIQYPAVVAA